ncbi:MAG TPA: ABC transporter permease [Acidimicrobiales bacterium]|jgi:ABC transporter DrrB family efflux protein|nr:ABC transporter permease [Acidimicrobiales bacterium]
MTTLSLPSLAPIRPSVLERISGPVRDVWSLTRRNLVHVRREPMQLSDVTIQPVLFTLLFIYVFGSGIPIVGGYKNFALAGLLTLNLTTSTMGTAVGLSTDLHEGVIDRFRTLPMWRAAILVGRSISDVLSAAVCVTIVALTGLAIGWRPDASIPSVIGGFGLALLFSYCLSWASACVGLTSKGPESAQSFGFLVLFPMAFISNSLVPTQGMPGWLQAIADWNPVSAVTAGARHMFGNPNPSATVHAWPMQHPVEASLLWSLVFLVVFAPLASYLFRRATSE